MLQWPDAGDIHLQAHDKSLRVAIDCFFEVPFLINHTMGWLPPLTLKLRSNIYGKDTKNTKSINVRSLHAKDNA